MTTEDQKILKENIKTLEIIEKNPEFHYVHFTDEKGKDRVAIRPKKTWNTKQNLAYHKKNNTEPMKMLDDIVNKIERYNSLFPNLSDKLILTLESQLPKQDITDKILEVENRLNDIISDDGMAELSGETTDLEDIKDIPIIEPKIISEQIVIIKDKEIKILEEIKN